MKLYDIKKELLDIYSDLVDEETGEIDEEKVHRFEQLSIAKEEKEENTALYIKTLDYDIKSLKEEKKRIDRKIKSAEQTKGFLKGMLEYSLAGQTIKTPQVTVSYRKSESVKLDDDFIDYAMKHGYEDLVKESIDYKAKKTEIKKKLKAGEKIPHCELEIKQNIQIK